MIRATNRLLSVWAPVLAACVLLSCKTEEDKTREKIVGDYVSEYRGDGFYVKDVLTLTPGGTWKKSREILTRKGRQPTSPDSGTFRITGVTINLRSLVQGGVPVRYTILGDTLFGANATDAKVFTGRDIGEEVLVRQR
ncbi:MAG TPA: hypothetical protein VH762_05580 [Gemmatimonadaceae bacterium]